MFLERIGLVLLTVCSVEGQCSTWWTAKDWFLSTVVIVKFQWRVFKRVEKRIAAAFYEFVVLWQRSFSVPNDRFDFGLIWRICKDRLKQETQLQGIFCKSLQYCECDKEVLVSNGWSDLGLIWRVFKDGLKREIQLQGIFFYRVCIIVTV